MYGILRRIIAMMLQLNNCSLSSLSSIFSLPLRRLFFSRAPLSFLSQQSFFFLARPVPSCLSNLSSFSPAPFPSCLSNLSSFPYFLLQEPFSFQFSDSSRSSLFHSFNLSIFLSPPSPFLLVSAIFFPSRIFSLSNLFPLSSQTLPDFPSSTLSIFSLFFLPRPLTLTPTWLKEKESRLGIYTRLPGFSTPWTQPTSESNSLRATRPWPWPIGNTRRACGACVV